MEVTQCKYCEDDIIWITANKNGKNIPCNAIDINPTEFSNEDGPLMTEEGDWISVGRAREEEGVYYMPHFKHCG